MNRNIWGAEGFEEISIRHSKFASHRFAHQAAPALERFATSSPAPFLAGIRAAREQIVARKDVDRDSLLRTRGSSRPDTEPSIPTVQEEAGRPPESIFDIVPRIPALARTPPPPRKTGTE